MLYLRFKRNKNKNTHVSHPMYGFLEGQNMINFHHNFHNGHPTSLTLHENDRWWIINVEKYGLTKKTHSISPVGELWNVSLQWCHNEHDGISNHWCIDYLLNHLFRRRSKKTSKLRVTGLCEGNSPVTGEFPTQRASNVENVSIWWYHHVLWIIWRKNKQIIMGLYCSQTFI